jgi:hypothetical protein
MQLTVDSVTRGEKSYKVMSAGQAYFVGFKSASGIEQTLGKTIEAEVSTSTDGKASFINKFAVVGATTGSFKAAGPTTSTDRWFMPFVSNTVAHAIQSGLIKEPTDIRKWACAALETAQQLDKGDTTPF